MSLREQADKTTEEICKLLGVSPSPEIQASVSDSIEKTLIETALNARNRCAEMVMGHSQGEKDLAHEISENIRRSSDVLVTNLSSLR